MTELSLCIPGLLGPLPGVQVAGAELPGVPALCRYLARASRRGGPRDAEDALAGLGGYSRQDFPAARLRYLAETGGMAGPGELLCADPVHLRADQDVVRVFDAELGITAEEAASLCDAFNAFEADTGLRLEWVTPEHWYLHLPGDIDISTTPLHRARGQDIDPLLPQGVGRPRWHALLNEWQMLLFQQPVNQQRQQAGRPMINGLWLWGEGELFDGRTEARTLWSDDPVVQGVGRHLSINSRPLPDDPEHWLETIGPGRHWLYMPQLAQPLAYMDYDQWYQGVAALDALWFKPLLAAIHNGRVTQATLYPCNGFGYRYGRGSRYRFWQRPRPLSRFLQ